MSETEEKISIREKASQNIEKTIGTADEYTNDYLKKRRFLLFKRDPAKARREYLKFVEQEEMRLGKILDKARKRELSINYPDPVKNKKMKSFVRIVRQGYRELIECKEINAETIEVEIDGNNETIYTGVKPKIERLPSSILPSIAARLFGGSAIYIRSHFMRWGEPFTRDEFTGEILEEERKISVLVEKGFFTAKTVDGKTVYEPNDKKVDTDAFKLGGFTIYDVSNIDFMAAEVGSIFRSKLLQKYWEEAKRIGGAMGNWLPWVVIGIVSVAGMFFAAGGMGGA